MKGIFPASAIPAAIAASDCSATPNCTKREGNAFLKSRTRVDSLKSAHNAITRSSFLPAITTPRPNPLRVGSAGSLSKIFLASFAEARMDILFSSFNFSV